MAEGIGHDKIRGQPPRLSRFTCSQRAASLRLGQTPCRLAAAGLLPSPLGGFAAPGLSGPAARPWLRSIRSVGRALRGLGLWPLCGLTAAHDGSALLAVQTKPPPVRPCLAGGAAARPRSRCRPIFCRSKSAAQALYAKFKRLNSTRNAALLRFSGEEPFEEVYHTQLEKYSVFCRFRGTLSAP